MNLCFALLIATAPESEVVTLEQLRAQALESRPELALQEARIAEAAARVDEAEAPLRPQVAGRLEVTASPGAELVTVEDVDVGGEFVVAGSKAITEGLEAFEPQIRYSAQVGLTWNLWDFGRTDAATRAARAERRAREAEAAQSRHALVSAVDEVYLEWLEATERARLEKEAVERLTARLRDLRGLVDAGTLARSALLPVEADLAAARLRQSYADDSATLAKMAVGSAVGRALPEPATPDVRLLSIGDDLATKTATITRDPVDEALSARMEAAWAAADVHDRRNLPQLGAAVSAGVSGQFATVFPFYQGLLSMQFPIYDGGAGAAQADAARADARAVQLRRQQHRTEVRQQRTRAQFQLTRARARVGLAEALVRAAEARLVDAVQRYEASAAAPGELSQARAQRGQAAAQLLTAKIDRVRAALALER